MKNIMYIASLNTKKDRFDGERIKSTLIYESLIKFTKIFSLINLSKNKVLSVIKLIIVSLFCKHKIDYFVISKDPRGAKIIEKILNFCLVNHKKRIYFEIGPFLYDMLSKKNVNPSLFSKNKYVVVEAKSMKKELELFDFKNILIFPNFKRKPSVTIEKKNYPKKIVKLIYLSRIEEQKGIYELVDAVKVVNKIDVKYELDIYGMFMSKSDETRLFDEIKGQNEISYKGKLDMSQESSYGIISKYDLHVFPTWYDEGFPGTLIDFFFVGVPTISSSFLRSKDILSNEDSFIYKQHNKADLIKSLRYIYENQDLISKKGAKTFELGNLYTSVSFDAFIKELIYG